MMIYFFDLLNLLDFGQKNKRTYSTIAPPLDIFTLHHFTCPQSAGHYVLMRVERPGYSNASQVEDDRAHEIEEQRRTKLLQIYEKHVLQSLCPHIHYNTTVGIFEMHSQAGAWERGVGTIRFG